MDRLLRIWPLVFLIISILEQTLLFRRIADPIFYIVMGLGLIILLHRFYFIKRSDIYNQFPFLYGMVIIFTIYQFSFGLFESNERSWVYYISKVVSLSIIMISVSEFPRFNRYTLSTFFSYIIVFLTILGHFVLNITLPGARKTLGFLNPNAMGALAACAFGILLFTYNTHTNKLEKWIIPFCIFECLVSVLESGSRTAMIMIIIAIIYKFIKNLKSILIGTITIGCLLWILPHIGIKMVAFDRFAETIESSNFSEGRENERAAALVMIRAKPIEGNGLYAIQNEESLKISEFGSHNGYLDFLKMLGIPLGGLLILILLLTIIRDCQSLYNTEDNYIKANLFIVIGVALASMNEAYLWGVNQPVTTLFLISIANVGFAYHENKLEGI